MSCCSYFFCLCVNFVPLVLGLCGCFAFLHSWFTVTVCLCHYVVLLQLFCISIYLFCASLWLFFVAFWLFLKWYSHPNIAKTCEVIVLHNAQCLILHPSVHLTTSFIITAFDSCSLPVYLFWSFSLSFCSKYWPLFLLFFYILSPIPYCISRRVVDDTDSASNACKELAIFLTTGIVISAFGLPIVFARAEVVSYSTLLVCFVRMKSSGTQFEGLGPLVCFKTSLRGCWMINGKKNLYCYYKHLFILSDFSQLTFV